MFGYVRAVTSVLSPEDAQRYEAVYCGLCRTLGTVSYTHLTLPTTPNV